MKSALNNIASSISLSQAAPVVVTIYARKSYRPISLLYGPYKIFERSTYADVKSIIDPLLPKEQGGFRRGNQPWIKSFC